MLTLHYDFQRDFIRMCILYNSFTLQIPVMSTVSTDQVNERHDEFPDVDPPEGGAGAEHHLHITGPLLGAVHPAEGDTLHRADQQRTPGQQVAVQGTDQVQTVLRTTHRQTDRQVSK